jgi:hypothetical protein
MYNDKMYFKLAMMNSNLNTIQTLFQINQYQDNIFKKYDIYLSYCCGRYGCSDICKWFLELAPQNNVIQYSTIYESIKSGDPLIVDLLIDEYDCKKMFIKSLPTIWNFGSDPKHVEIFQYFIKNDVITTDHVFNRLHIYCREIIDVIIDHIDQGFIKPDDSQSKLLERVVLRRG